MKVRTFINEGPGRFFGYEPGDRLVEGPVLRIEAADEEAALDEAWHVGNRMAPDADGAAWPRTTRSLSVGDVLIVGETAFSVRHVGFGIVGADALALSLSAKAKEAVR